MKGIAILFIGLVLLSALACAQPEESTDVPKMTAGVYVSSFSGFQVLAGAAEPIPVYVTVGPYQITDITWESPLDSASVGQLAAPVIKDRILHYQTTEVDKVTGASLTSDGLKKAVADALKQARASSAFTSAPKTPAPAAKADVSENVGILVIGSGIAGLSAAVQAKTTSPSATVVLIEKQDMLGGSTKLSAGVVYAAVDDADIPVLKAYYKMRGQGNVDNALVDYWADESQTTLTFLGIGPGFSMASGTAAEARMRMSSGGPGLVNYLAGEARNKGVDIRTGIKATGLIVNESGRVVGVKAESKTTNYTFTTTYTSQGWFGPQTVNGSVIIATGGFDSDRIGNDSLMALHNPDSKQDIPQSSSESLGEGIKMAQAIGADTVFKGGKIGWVGIDVSLGEASHYYSAVIKGDGTLLNLDPPANVTYAQHKDDYAVVHRRMLDARKDNPSEKFWALTNSPANEVYVTKGVAFQDTTVAGLAQKIGVDPTNLQASFASGQEIGNMMGPSASLTASGAVFTATKAIPSSIGSMGGIKINTDAAVLKGGVPIPGLYAAGECANGDMFYLEYPGSGSSLSISATFGRTAGAKAAAGL
jgi:succinate dehydrogenase/fumarate reductase flavoprotein subunit/uncharacterized protein with FMN-binding domain